MKRFFMKRIILLILMGCVLAGVPASASDTTSAVKQFMQRVQQAYKSASYLSFHVVYRYANKNQPNNYIDSMSGEVALDKNRMRFTLEEVETVTNDKYTIQVMNDEKLIYLSIPKQSQLTDPVAMLDSALAHFNGIHTQITHEKGIATLQLLFPPGQSYKTITMIINESTGYFQKVMYELYTEGLVEKDQLIERENNGTYQSEGRVEVVFSQYRQGQFTDAMFSEERFFTRLGQGKYEPSEQFKNYQIFLASPTL
jgi:outer membrane lipoprotein-sorting protein